jgi:hypothetical protein
MIYVKFDTDNKSIEMRIDPPAENAGDYVEVADDTLFGKRLIKTKTKIREFTQKEHDDEFTTIDRANKAMIIDNMAREMLKTSYEETPTDVYDELPANKKAAIKIYRDALRDVNKQEKYPEYVDFPDKPKIAK